MLINWFICYFNNFSFLSVCVFAAIRHLKDEESIQCTSKNEVQPVLEEFIPLKKDCDRNEENKKEKDHRDKKNWMSSVQLWNTDDYPFTDGTKQNPKLDTKV